MTEQIRRPTAQKAVTAGVDDDPGAARWVDYCGMDVEEEPLVAWWVSMDGLSRHAANKAWQALDRAWQLVVD